MSTSVASRRSISVTEPSTPTPPPPPSHPRLRHVPPGAGTPPSSSSAAPRGADRPPRASPPDETAGGPGSRRAPSCCFCWCCSCSRERIQQQNPPEDSVHLTQDELRPSLEEIRQWGESFDKVMQSYTGRQVFSEFLRSEYSEDNMLFWLACEELKRETDLVVIHRRALSIYEDYISILSPKEVSLDSRVREELSRTKENPTNEIFNEAQIQIYTLMQRDPYPRFVNSQFYKLLANP